MNRYRYCQRAAFVVLISAELCASSASADILFESGTLGPTGVTFSDLTNGTVPSTNVKNNLLTGVRFQLKQPVLTSQIGGHFVGRESGTFFGAIVTLDDENDFPNSFDFNTPDVLGTALLTFPILSDEVFGNLSLSLDPGWYALVFGSGLFEATANGATVRNGNDIGDPFYIGPPRGPGGWWINLEGIPSDFRYVVKGSVVPEPTAIVICVIGSVCLLFRRRT